MKDVDGRFQVIVYSGRIGDEADTFSFEAFEVLFFQNLNTGFDFYFLCLYGEGQQALRIINRNLFINISVSNRYCFIFGFL